MKLHSEISAKWADWIAEQRLFFVGTAPLSRSGHVNISPKGGDSFRVLGPLEVAYQDYTGSGAETMAHLRENQRIVIMFCSFEGPPNILRLHGEGSALRPGQAEYERLASSFAEHLGTRAIVRVKVTRIASSCGYAVPFFDYGGPRDTLDRWTEKKGPEGLSEYRRAKNQRSIDGLVSFESVEEC